MSTRTRIISHIFRPDVWFVMPPACNVVFPEECASVGYNRRMMLETTRLQLQTFSSLLDNAGGGVSDELLKNYYFAPALDETKFKTLSGSIDVRRNEKGEVVGLTQPGSATEVINAIHYEHEKYTGIIPRIEQISDTAFYAAAQRQIDAAGTTAPSQSNSTVVPDSPVDIYAQRAATFNLLRYRYAGRTASVSARFMPRLVAGFPALIVNRPKEVDTDAPIHFLGLISSLSHTVGQSGGTTNFQLSYARQHNIAEDEDSFLSGLKGLRVSKSPSTQLYFGSESKGVEYLTKVNRQLRAVYNAQIGKGFDHDDAVSIYQLVCSGNLEGARSLAKDAGIALTCFDKGPEGSPVKGVAGLFIGVSNPTRVSELAGFAASNPLIGLGALDLIGIASDGTAPNDQLGKYITDESDPTVPDIPKVMSLSVVEDKSVPVSFEEAITPPWFSASYGNAKISSDIYEPALGCASLGAKVGNSSSAQAASEKMVSKYSASEGVRTVQGDPKFVYDYTHREIPSLSEVLAFHANAFDPSKAGSSRPLYGLDAKAGGVVEKSATVLKNGFKDTPLDLTGAGYLDPRQERQKRVSFYLNQLNSRSAFRG